MDCFNPELVSVLTGLLREGKGVEYIMRPDVLIVLILALLFFGGVGYLVWNDRKRQELPADEPPAPAKDDIRQPGKRKRRQQ
jgi:hypothetical protein